MVLTFRNVGEKSDAKNYHPVSLCSMIFGIFEKLVNNRLVDQLEKCFSVISSTVAGLLGGLQIF